MSYNDIPNCTAEQMAEAIGQTAKEVIKRLYFDGQGDLNVVRAQLRWLAATCDDAARRCTLEAALRALNRVLGDEFKAVLFGIAELQMSTPRHILKQQVNRRRDEGGDPWGR